MTVTIHCGTTQFKYSGVASVTDVATGDDKDHIVLTFKGYHSRDKHNKLNINYINVELKDINL